MREHADAELLTAPRDGNRWSPKAFITQELLREAIFQVYLSLDRLRNNKRFASWLYGISLNVFRNSLRSQKREVSSLEAMVGGMFIDPAMLSEGGG